MLTLHSCCQAEEGQEPFRAPEVVQEGQGEAADTENRGAILSTLKGTVCPINTGAGARLETLHYLEGL